MPELSFERLFSLFRAGGDLDEQTAPEFIDFLANEESSSIEIAALTAAWKIKGYKSRELVVISRHLTEQVLSSLSLDSEVIVDCCGVGGDGANTFNISTASAFLVAASGLKVAKHGGRRTSSQTGSIDFLEELGVHAASETTEIRELFDKLGLVFIASPALGRLLAHWKQVCRQLEIPGQTGLIGTLTNPVNITHQLIGIPRPDWAAMMIEAMKSLGRQRGAVVFGEPGLDEISVCGKTSVWEFKEKEQAVVSYQLNPQDYQLGLYELKDIQGGIPSTNARIFLELLKDPDRYLAIRDALLFNSGFLLYLSGESPSIEQGIAKIRTTLYNGLALKFFESLT